MARVGLVHKLLLLTIMNVANKRRQMELRKRRKWSREWLRRRGRRDVFNNLLQELRLEDYRTFQNFHQMTPNEFRELLGMVEPLIRKEDTVMRKAVSTSERLAVTLRYLATGESHRSLEMQFRISHNLISSIIPTVCKAIYQVLQPLYIVVPDTVEKWQEIAHNFFQSWNFPMCIGAIDRKRVLIVKSPNLGLEYYDYKAQNSVLMLGVVDADYKFIFIDVRSCEASDTDIWEKCPFRKALENDALNVPGPANVPFTSIKCPYVLVGDDTFPHKTYIMNPYPGEVLEYDQRIFNYRLSRARRISENAFGILSSKFRIYRQPINTSSKKVEDIVLCTVALHNFLRSKKSPSPGEVDQEDIENMELHRGQWRAMPHGALRDLPADGRGCGNNANMVRDRFKHYFVNEGVVPWQEAMSLITK